MKRNMKIKSSKWAVAAGMARYGVEEIVDS
jgi:hypothetical protein